MVLHSFISKPCFIFPLIVHKCCFLVSWERKLAISYYSILLLYNFNEKYHTVDDDKGSKGSKEVNGVTGAMAITAVKVVK